MSSLHLRLLFLLGVTSIAACQPSKGPERGCTEIACDDGVHVEFTYRDPGQYVFEVTVDGQLTTCRATLPLPRETGPSACDKEGVYLGLVGSMLPREEQSLSGLILKSTTANSIHIRATRDGTLLGESTVSPAYRTSPGPNGAECEPRQCKQAQYSFP